MLLRRKCFWVSLLKTECPCLSEGKQKYRSLSWAVQHSSPRPVAIHKPSYSLPLHPPHTLWVRPTLEIDNLAWELYCAFKCKLLGNWQLLCLNCNDWSTSVLGFFLEYILTGIYVLLHSSQAQIYARVLKLSSVNPWAVTFLLGNPFLWPIQQL